MNDEQREAEHGMNEPSQGREKIGRNSVHPIFGNNFWSCVNSPHVVKDMRLYYLLSSVLFPLTSIIYQFPVLTLPSVRSLLAPPFPPYHLTASFPCLSPLIPHPFRLVSSGATPLRTEPEGNGMSGG